MSERPIWTAGMEVINRALQPHELEKFRQEEIQRWAADNYRDALRRYLFRDPWGDA